MWLPVTTQSIHDIGWILENEKYADHQESNLIAQNIPPMKISGENDLSPVPCARFL
jgi:hypothetical protein